MQNYNKDLKQGIYYNINTYKNIINNLNCYLCKERDFDFDFDYFIITK